MSFTPVINFTNESQQANQSQQQPEETKNTQDQKKIRCLVKNNFERRATILNGKSANRLRKFNFCCKTNKNIPGFLRCMRNNSGSDEKKTRTYTIDPGLMI